MRKGGKSAFVFSKDVEFGLGRMFEALSEGKEGMPVEYRSFRDINEAREWLCV